MTKSQVGEPEDWLTSQRMDFVLKVQIASYIYLANQSREL